MKTIEALERFSNIIISKIESCTDNWDKPWFSCIKEPKNINGRKYSASNSLMLLLYCESKKFDNPVFLTFQQVQMLNKGIANEKNIIKINNHAKAFPIISANVMWFNEETKKFITQEAYNELDEDAQLEWEQKFVRKAVMVFNIHQTNMQTARPDLWKKAVKCTSKDTPADGELYPPFEIVKGSDEWICPIEDVPGITPCYNVMRNIIQLPPRNQFYNTEKYYGTAFHEMAHSTVVATKRQEPKTDSEYAREELIAELTSALVSASIGYNKYISEDSVPYMKEWICKLKESPEFIKTILEDVQKAENLITSALQKFEGAFYFEINNAA